MFALTFSHILFSIICGASLLYGIRIRISRNQIKKQFKLVQLENKAIKSDLKLKNSILDAIPYPIWVRNKDLTVTYFNKIFSHFISLDTKNIYSKTIEINNNERNLTKKSITLNKICSEEIYTIVDKDRYVYKFYAIPLENSEIVVSTAHDVTDKIQIKKDLEKHIVTQECLFESTGAAIAIYSFDTKLKFFNQVFLNLWKLDKQWLLSEPTYKTILEKLRDKRKIPEQIDFSIFIKEQLNLFSTITSTHNEFLHLPNGKTLRILMIPHALGGVLFSYEDITDKVVLERSYRTLTTVQKETLDHISDGITVFSENGKLEISNSKFTQMWNLEPQSTQNHPRIAEVLDKIYIMVSKKIKSKDDLKELFMQNINLRKTKHIIINRNDDSSMEILFVPLFNGATLISYRDITDATLIEKNLIERTNALKEADAIKTEFLANTSYELRTPLTSIMGFSEALLDKHIGQLTKKQTTYIRDIHTASHYLMNLINNVLDLASIDAGYMKLDLSKFNIIKMIKPTIKLLQQKIEGKNLTLKIEVAENIDNMIGDINRIKQIVFNLLSNAIIYSTPKGYVMLRIYKSYKNIILCVEDDGKGIGRKHHPYIFDRFYKANPRSVLSNPNMRFGLTLIKSFVELHGGKIEFSSCANKGSIFKCIFPSHNKELLAQYNHQQQKYPSHLEKLS